MYRLICFLVLSLGLIGQEITTSSLSLIAPPPPALASVSASIVGNAGNATYYYWVVVKYPIGDSNPSNSVIVRNAPNVLSGSNYVRLNWASMPNATGYDVLRTTTPNIPNGDCNCAVITDTTGNTVSDIGSALSAYTVDSTPAASTTCRLNNITGAAPSVSCDPISWGGGGDLSSSTTNPTQYSLVMYDTTLGTTVAEAVGCTWTSGGLLSCTGGFNAGTGVNPAVVELPELAVNGTNSSWIAGNTTQSADTCAVWPTSASTTGQVLADSGSTISVDPDGAGPVVARTCRVLTWSAAGGGGTVRTTYAALPACSSGNANYQYMLTDSIYTANCDGTSYAYWTGQKYIPTLPWSDGTTFGAGATVTATTGSVLFDGGTPTGGDSIRAAIKALPAAPYTVILDVDMLQGGTVGSSSCGLVITNGTTAASNSVITLMQSYLGLNMTKLTNATTYDSNYIVYSQATSRNKMSFRLVDDNTNRTWSVSQDRINWTQVSQQTRTDFMTATHYGYGCNMTGVAGIVTMTIEGFYAQ